MARPSKIDQTMIVPGPKPGAPDERITYGEAVLRGLRAGAYVEDAAKAAGVHVSTVYGWIARGQEHADATTAKGEPKPVPAKEQPYVEFSEDVMRVRGQAVLNALTCVRLAMRDDWRAAAWYLERTRPTDFGRQTRPPAESEPPEDPDDGIDYSKLDEEDLLVLEGLMTKARADR